MDIETPQIVLSRVFDAPRQLPPHLAGPGEHGRGEAFTPLGAALTSVHAVDVAA